VEGVGGDGARVGGVRPEWKTGRSDGFGVPVPPDVAMGLEAEDDLGSVPSCASVGTVEVVLGLGEDCEEEELPILLMSRSRLVKSLRIVHESMVRCA
jgi:hypothetical protein